MSNYLKFDKAVLKQRQRVTRKENKYSLSRRNAIKYLFGIGAFAIIGGGEAITKTGIFNSKIALADFSYDGAKTVQWADKYAISSGTDYASQTQGRLSLEAPSWEIWSEGTDCTNFVSNALLHGGFPPDHQWYCNGKDHDGSPNASPWSITLTIGTTTQQLNNGNKTGFYPWTVPGDLLHYMYTNGYGTIVNKFIGPQRGINETNGLAQGDLVFFSWKNNEYIDHMAIQGVGLLDSDGSTTHDQVDAHCADHFRAFWTLEDFWNGDGDIPNPKNVAIYVMHLSPNTAPALYIPTY